MKTETIIKPKTNLVRAENRVPRWVLPSVKFSIVLIDALLAFACFALAFIWREGDAVFSETAWAWSKEFVPYAGVVFFAVPVRVLMLWYQRAYRLQGAFSYIAEFIKIFKAVAIGSLLIIAFTFLFRGGFAFRDFSYSRGVFALDFSFALVLFSDFSSRLALSANAFSAARYKSDSDFDCRHKCGSRADDQRIKRKT